MIAEQFAEVLTQYAQLSVSDLHIDEGKPIRVRVPQGLIPVEKNPAPVTKDGLIKFLNQMDGGQMSVDSWHKRIEQNGGQVDLRFEFQDRSLRAAISHFGGNEGDARKIASIIRVIPEEIPTLEDTNLPADVLKLFDRPSGLLVVTGVTGSGKSTTMALGIQHRNQNRYERIITLEDPIERLYEDDKSMVLQRQLGRDFPDYPRGIKDSMRQDPDAIIIGEVNDVASLRAAITAALTGHFVMTTLHTLNCPETISRMIDLFPPEERELARKNLARVLVGVVSQTLVPSVDGKKRILAHEIMMANSKIRTLIRDDKVIQIPSELNKRRPLLHQMITSLAQLLKQDRISMDTARNAALAAGAEKEHIDKLNNFDELVFLSETEDDDDA